ncbi:MAG: DUF4386 family protein, partial [bacterium]
MIPRQQTAGMLGILAGISLAILFILFVTSGAEPDTFSDPAKAVPYITQNEGRLRTIAFFAGATVGLSVIFFAGLAGRLREGTPTRATGVLYFGILGLVGHGLSALILWLGAPALVDYAARDQVAVSHAWVAISALNGALDGFGNLFVGLSILLAGWAITTGRGLSSALGWYGVVAGALTALATAAPGNQLLFAGSVVLPAVWLIWAG